MIKKTVLLLTISFLGFTFCYPSEGKLSDYPEYLIYLPSKIDPSKKHPLIVGLSPGGNAQSVISTWKEVSEENGWIIYASKIFHNEGDMNAMLSSVANNLSNIFANFPVDSSKVIATGLSGGGMGAHALAFSYPHLITGVVINTGMMHEYYSGQKLKYPKSKIAVFLASPTDFRYGEMKRDRDFLESLNWKTKWIEFSGGHTMAPGPTYKEAAAWLNEQWRYTGGHQEEEEKDSKGSEVQNQSSSIKIEGIFSNPSGKSYAITNGEIVTEGDTIKGAKVSKINKESVEISTGEGSKIIKVQ